MAKVPGSWEKAENLTGPLAGPNLATQPVPPVVDDPDRLTPDELSIVTPEQFERAFEEYRQPGPRGYIPIAERWPAVIPDVDPSKYPALEAKCYEITWAVVRWDDDVKCGRLRDEDDVVKRMVALRYPYLTQQRQVAVRIHASFMNR